MALLYSKGRFLSYMPLHKLYVFYLLPVSFQCAPLDRVKAICQAALKQQKKLSQAAYQIISTTSLGLFKKK